MGRKILAVVVALITATAIMLIVEMINSKFMMPPSTDVMNDPAKLREYMANGPVIAYVVVLIGYFLGSFGGGYIVTKMSRRESPGVSLSILVGAILTLLMVVNILMLPGQPVWFIALGLLTFIPVSLLGHKLAT